MSTATETEVAPLTAGAAAFPPAQSSNPFSRSGPLPASVVAELVEDDPPVESPVEEAEPEQDAEPAQDAEPNPLVAEATERYGIAEDVAESLGDKLESVLAAMDKQASALMRESLAKRQPEQQSPPAQPEPVKTEPVKPLEKLKIELDPEVYDESQIKVFESLAEQINKQQEVIQALAQLAVNTHDGVKNITGQSQAEAGAQFERSMDSFFAGLGDEFKDTFGKSPVRQLATTSPEFESRNKLVEEMGLLELADAQAGRPKGTPEQYAQRALRVVHADKLKTIARKEVLNEVSTRRKQAIHRPSSHNGSALTPRQRAEKFIAESLRKSGIGVEE